MMEIFATGPYNGGSIGMDKDYYCSKPYISLPPHFPYLARCPDDGASTASMTMITYQPVTTDIKAIYECDKI